MSPFITTDLISNPLNTLWILFESDFVLQNIIPFSGFMSSNNSINKSCLFLSLFTHR